MASSLSPSSFASDEDLWFGKRRDDEAESAASKSLAATAARIVGAKPFPLAARRLEELTRTANARIEQVVSVLESDPALSARLLRLVNSAGYGLKVRCTSVRHAAVLVGTRRLNQVATTAAILDLFETNNALATELLEHAAIVGSLCRYLAVHLGLPHDELFTCGFLHDIGKIMLLDTEREVYPSVLEQFGGRPDAIHEEERRLFGFDHAVLGAHVLTSWNIPDPVPKVIAWHHQPARALQDSLLSAMVQTLRLADLLAYELGRRSEQEGALLVASSEAAQYLDISEPQLSAMWNDLVSLRERSRARSHGDTDLEVAEPRLSVPSSLRPRSSLAPRSMRPGSVPTHGSIAPQPEEAAREAAEKDVPQRLHCVVCGQGSYGNRCGACSGHVCPDHQHGADEWCTLCVRDFAEFRRSERAPLMMRVGVAVAIAFSCFGSFLSAWSAGGSGLQVALAPVLLCVVWALVLPIAWRLYVKLSFLKSLPEREPPAGAKPSTSDTGELRPEGAGDSGEPRESDLDAPLVPSVMPSYEYSTQPSVRKAEIQPFPNDLMRPPAEADEAPLTNRSPLVLRVDVPSLDAVAPAMRPASAAIPTDQQLSPVARIGAPRSRAPQQDEDLPRVFSEAPRPALEAVPRVASVAPVAEPRVSVTPAEPRVSVTPVAEPRVSVTPVVETPAATPVAEPRVSVTPVVETPAATPIAEPRVSVTPVAEPRVSVTPVAEPRVSVTPVAEPPAIEEAGPQSSNVREESTMPGADLGIPRTEPPPPPVSLAPAAPQPAPVASGIAPAPAAASVPPLSAPAPALPPSPSAEPAAEQLASASSTSVPAASPSDSEELSGVHFVATRNHAGLTRDACSPTYAVNRCS